MTVAAGSLEGSMLSAIFTSGADKSGAKMRG